jgi:hypothetical protein
MLTSCGEQSEEKSQESSLKFQSQPIISLADVESLEEQPETIRPELADAFCIHSYKLPLKSDFDAELGYLCQDNTPTELFSQIDRYAKIVGDEPRSVQLAIEHQGGRSLGAYATVYEVPIAPKWVRSASIGDYMTTSSVFDYINMQGQMKADLSDNLGGDLQFGKNELNYVTEVTTPDGNAFTNERTTELNSFQVQGGNSDIGLGAEHLTNSPDNGYQTYNTITVTIGNKAGGSILITIINIDVNNNGYPDLTEKVMSDIATAQANHVHDGLMRDLTEYFIEE